MNKQEKRSNPKAKLISAILICLAAALILLAIFAVKPILQRLADQKTLRNGEYNSVFLSMFPIDTFDEADFMHFRGDQLAKITTILPNCRTLKSYLNDVSKSGNQLRVLYLGVDPRKVNAAQVLQFRDMFPGVQLEVIPAYRPLSDWLADPKADETLKAYVDLAQHLLDQQNIRVFSFFAQEWIIANPANYEEGLLLREETARLLYVYTDDLHHCQFTREDFFPRIGDLENLLQEAKSGAYTFPDLSDWDIAFFGDSVIGNYKGSHSIPNLVASLSGANCYNCGWGGTTASGSDPSSGVNVIKSYFDGILPEIPENVGVQDDFRRKLADAQNASGKRELFVLHYGINDYLKGVLLESEDPYDPNTYCGALRTIIETIRQNRPNASIFLMTPTPLICYHHGEDVGGENCSPLSAFVEAIGKIAREYDLPVQDTYHDVIPIENMTHLMDGEIHPNEYGRYLIVKEFLRIMKTCYQ